MRQRAVTAAIAATLVLAGAFIAPGPTRTGRDERGSHLVEHAMLLVLIVVGCIAAIRALGNTMSRNSSSVSNGF